MNKHLWTAVHVFVGVIYVMLLAVCVIGIFTAVANGVYYASLLFLLMIGTMIYFATDGWKKRDE